MVALTHLAFSFLLIIFVKAKVNLRISLNPATLDQQVDRTWNLTVHCTIREQQELRRRRNRYNSYYQYYDDDDDDQQANASILTRLRFLVESKASFWQPIAQITKESPGEVYIDPATPNVQAEGSISYDMLMKDSEIIVKWNGPVFDAVKKFKCDALTFDHDYKNSPEYHSSETNIKTDALTSSTFTRLSGLFKDTILTDVLALQKRLEMPDESKLNRVVQRKDRAKVEEKLSRIRSGLAQIAEKQTSDMKKMAQRMSSLVSETRENQTKEMLSVESIIHTAFEGSFVMLWPKGTYALPKPAGGCPSTKGVTWQTGERHHHTESTDRNKDEATPDNHLVQPVLHRVEEKNFIYQHFCVKTNDDTFGSSWPNGSYCINRYLECPQAFKEGAILWDDENYHPNSTTLGKLPSGNFSASHTEFFYCCRDDGTPEEPVGLPRFQPFYLYRYGGQCQKVAGMNVTEEYVRFDTENSENNDQLKDFHPDAEINNLILYLCYYEKP
ncbi:Apextrin-like protein 2 [Plakobranchus ocellatus]|uniref:Apextrin-like protein 2 n=1 Tax=Plakobranchus ocellatus TaxID=259542 RepID=A0AAV3ZHA7_9GAST|nr:Apextrin-like protein 2 [Plakobranchus ocellatus]